MKPRQIPQGDSILARPEIGQNRPTGAAPDDEDIGALAADQPVASSLRDRHIRPRAPIETVASRPAQQQIATTPPASKTRASQGKIPLAWKAGHIGAITSVAGDLAKAVIGKDQFAISPDG